MSYLEEKTRKIMERGAHDRAVRGPGGWWNNLSVIPVPAWIIAALVYTGMLLFTLLYVFQNDANMKLWSPWQKIPFATLMPLFLAVLVLLIGYVNGDAKRRGMRYVMWTLLAIFVPNALGIILYFLLRDPLPAPCPSCGTRVGGAFAFCPQCGTVVSPSCPHCRRTVDRAWANCAYCGTKLPGASQTAA
jgi:double zinc ribbon protein